MHTVRDLPASLLLTSNRVFQAVSFTAAVGSFVAVTDSVETTPADSIAASSSAVCIEDFDADADFPPLPALAGADFRGEPGIVLHLEQHRGVVDLGGCLYEVDRPLAVDFAGLERIMFVIELHGTPENTELFVTDDFGGLEVHTADGPLLTVPMGADASMGFEVTTPGQSAPTVPVVVAKPIEEDPPPT
ncbi:MAG: hypothetical protein KC431_29265 [Myxococcales bacterium]|nr:hypothetical protein [Myxococcales bacterium]